MCISPYIPGSGRAWGGGNARHSTVKIAQEKDSHRTKFHGYWSVSTQFLDPPLTVPKETDQLRPDASYLEYNSSVSRIPGD